MVRPAEYRLRILMNRIELWEDLEEDVAEARAEELILDIKQCLESILDGKDNSSD